MKQEKTDYFKNHGIGKRWPFSIYHQPIEDNIYRQLIKIGKIRSALNIGCGFFDSYPKLRKFGAWYACDIDKRCLESVKKLYPQIKLKLVKDLPEYPKNSFDFIFSSEVIEHVDDPKKWLKRIFEISRPKATVFVSTPNYGWSLLPIIEYTFLQVIAMSKGFSRFGLHPNKYTKKKLLNELKQMAPVGSQVEVKTCSFGMVLCGVVKLPMK